MSSHESSPASMTLNDVLALEFQLPSIPKVVALLLSELERPETDLRRINQLIGRDLALSTRLLRLANSDFFRLSGSIHCVSEALALLNLDQVRGMTREAATAASLKAVPGIQLQQFWDYSLNVARVSRALAGVVRQNQQAAFTCGLLHAFGELAMHLAMPREMAELNTQIKPMDLRRAIAEQRKFGFNWAGVSAGFARAWKFPQTMVDALEHQYAPFDAGVYEPLAGVVHLSSWRARCKEAGLSERGLAVTFPDKVGVPLGLDIDMVLQQDPFDWGTPN